MSAEFQQELFDNACEKLLGLFSDGSSIVKVCVKLGIHRDTYYEWKKAHPKFKKIAEQGEQAAEAYWEDLAQKGCVGEFDKFSAPMTIFMMKNRFRRSYGVEEEAKKSESEAISAVKDAVEKIAENHKKDA